jgi:hypothetical protein
VVVTVRTVSTVSTGVVAATVEAAGSRTPDGGTATGPCTTTARPTAGATTVCAGWARAAEVAAMSAIPRPAKITLFLIENSLHFSRIGPSLLQNAR